MTRIASLRMRIRGLKEKLRSSLWFLPAITSILAFGSAKGLVAVDRRFSPDASAWYLFAGQPDSGRVLLSTIASSMITFTGLVFSITILVLQLASSQFSPRILRTFLQDRKTQLAMSAFVSTFVFTMALLPEVRSAGEEYDGFVPALSLFMAFALVMLSVAVFIRFIDHMAQSVRAVTIIKRVGTETRRAVLHMYPRELLDRQEAALRAPEDRPAVVLHEGRGGVLSAVDEKRLMELATERELVLALVPMPGDFVAEGAPLFRVWGGDAPEGLQDTVLVEDERTLHQDPGFGFRQLVDIAERALSPGINDPSTAVQVLDELHDLLRLLVRRHFPSPERADEGGRLRLVLPRPDWPAYVHLALDEIRQYGSRSVQVLRRLRALLLDCLSVAPEARRPPLERQLELLDKAIEDAFPVEEDAKIARKPSIQGHGQQ